MSSANDVGYKCDRKEFSKITKWRQLPLGYGTATTIEEEASYRYLPSGIMLSYLSMKYNPKDRGVTERHCGDVDMAASQLRTDHIRYPSVSHPTFTHAKDNCTTLLHVFEAMLSAIISGVEGVIR
jgi:hypothetical protein